MALETALRRAVRGEVRFDRGSRALYSTDASNYRQVPIGVVLPRDADDLVASIVVCAEHGVPVLPRGAGTSLAGQCCNVAVVIDTSRHLDRVVAVDPEREVAVVEPGVILDTLRAATAPYGLTFGPDPSTADRCTLGGMIGNNACGVHSLKAGRTSDNVEQLDLVLADGTRLGAGPLSEQELDAACGVDGRIGEVHRALRALRDRFADAIRTGFPPIPRRVSGYNLDELLPERGFHLGRALAGSEGTCATVVGATVRLVRLPAHRVLAVIPYPDVVRAAADVPRVLDARPDGLEALDRRVLEGAWRLPGATRAAHLLPDAGAWLLVDFGAGLLDEAGAKATELLAELGTAGQAGIVVADAADQRIVWAMRAAGVGATTRLTGQGIAWPGWEDAAVAPWKLADYLEDFQRLVHAHGFQGAIYGHFGDGCVHVRLDYDLERAEGIGRFRTFVEQAADLVVAHGGSLSGEHGDGQARGELLERMFGAELVGAFRVFKGVFDPEGRMNPGKVVDARPFDADLRVFPRAGSPQLTTRFAYAEDGGSFRRATLRCVGVGTCRRAAGGTMCPSYMVTREEAHSTRGRARLLFEMTEGGVISDGWRSEEVRSALELCLACKACKRECPVGVDVATYKSEFLAHYYEGRLRPPVSYAMGLAHLWLRLGILAPGLANRALSSRAGRGLLGALGVARAADLPPLTGRTFSASSRARARDRRRPGPRGPLVLWADTFTDHLDPGVAAAATVVLEHAGFEVVPPPARLCCGRPLYDQGMLRLAERQLRRFLAVLGEIPPGVPVVGLEPSCVAVLRDELPGLLPGAESEAASARVSTLGELLASVGYSPPPLDGRALVQRHCHQEAVVGTAAELALLTATGLEVDLLDAGCCGMAGSFGFDARTHDVSVRVGERALLPAVRAAAPGTVIVADGFSCREQIRQRTGRAARHTAQVLRAALDGQEVGSQFSSA